MQKFRRFDICNRLTSALDAVLKGLKEDISSKTILEQGISQAVEVILEQIGIPLSEKAAQPVLEDERVAMAKQYICENLHRMLSCEEVAKHCGLSAKQLNRIFLRCVGMTIFGYTKMVRLQKCEELLLTSGDSIKEISSRLGFQNTYYFSNFFKRNYGIPPAYFRNKNANLGSLKGEKEKNYG
jgi:AraC-like DNA-binding protein